MGRRPRMLVAGGVYHVSNCVSRGDDLFRSGNEADKLEALFAETTKRGGFQILA